MRLPALVATSAGKLRFLLGMTNLKTLSICVFFIMLDTLILTNADFPDAFFEEGLYCLAIRFIKQIRM